MATKRHSGGSIRIKKPYDVSGKFEFDDDVMQAVASGLQRRQEQKRAAHEARAKKVTGVSKALREFVPNVGLAAAVSAADLERMRKAVATMLDSYAPAKAADPRAGSTYRKRPYPTILASCTNRGPVYDWGHESTWGAGLGNLLAFPGATDGVLGGEAEFGGVGVEGVNVQAGDFVFVDGCGDDCGRVTAELTFETTGGWAAGGFGVYSISVQLWAGIFGYLENAWITETTLSLANEGAFVIGQNSASWLGQGNTLTLSGQIEQNGTYFVTGGLDIAVGGFGGEAAGARLISMLTNIHVCS
jgi:hypothetical protein